MDLEPEMVQAANSNSNSQQQQQQQQTQNKNKKMKVPLNSNDRIFAEVRDLNFSVLLPLLNKKAKEIDLYYKVSYLL